MFGLAKLDEPGVLGEAAGVEVERDAVLLTHRAHLAGIFHGDRLAATGVVRDGEHDERDAIAADAVDEGFESGDIHVAFEGMLRGGLLAFGDEQIDGFSTGEFDVGARGVKVGVVGDDVALLAHHAEENALSGAALVRGDDVPVAEDVLNGILEAIEAATAGVAFVAFHDGGPLVRGHRAGSGVGEQVDEDVVSAQQEKIVVCGFEELLALGAGGPADGLDTLDAEGFDDGAGDHGGRSRLYAREEVPTPPKRSLDPPRRRRPVCGDPGDGAPYVLL